MNCGTQLKICTLLHVGMQYSQDSKRKKGRNTNTKKVRNTAHLPKMPLNTIQPTTLGHKQMGLLKTPDPPNHTISPTTLAKH